MSAPLDEIRPWHTGPNWSGWVKPEAVWPAITAMNTLDAIAEIAWRDHDDRNIAGDGDLARIGMVLRAARDGMVTRIATRPGGDAVVSPPLETLDHITGILASVDSAASRMNRIREVLRSTGRGMPPATMPASEEEIHLDQSRIELLKAAGWRVAGMRAGSYVRLSPAGSTRESVLIPLDPSAPEYGEAMRAAVTHIRQIVACGTASAAALANPGPACPPDRRED